MLTDSERRSLEDQLNSRLLEACEDSEKAGYTPDQFRASLAKNGPVAAVSAVIAADPETSGFAALAAVNRLDLTGEAIALGGPWQALFDSTILDLARARLVAHNRPDLATD